MKHTLLLLSLCTFIACSDDSDPTSESDMAPSDMAGSDMDNHGDADMPDVFVPPESCTATHEPGLPGPGGRYCVGVTSLMVTDASRPNTVLDEPERDIVLHVYYPTYTDEGEPYKPLSTDFSDLFQVPEINADLLLGHGIVDAPLAQGENQFPVLMFMPGYTAPVGAFSSWIEHMVSHGWVVVGVEHPGISFTRYPDGTTLAAERTADPAFFSAHFEDVVKDTQYVRNLLDNSEVMPIDPARLELTEFGYFGQSYGGATAAGACELDATCKAFLNVDGAFFNSEPALYGPLTKPWGVILSDGRYHNVEMPADSTLSETFANTTAPAFYAELAGATHLGLSDLVFLYEASGVGAPLTLGSLYKTDLYESITEITRTFFEVHQLGFAETTVENVADDYAFVGFGRE